jgi:hypothetical protein
MQFTTIIAILATATTSLAAPAPAPATVNMMAAQETWTVKNFLRTCNQADTTCAYSFTVQTPGTADTSCKYSVNGSPASHQSYNSVACGNFRIGSSWSGQFGPGEGFQTLSVVRNKQIIYPAYKDTQLKNGVVVQPDQVS